MQYIDCLINPLTRTVQYPGNTTIVQRDTNVEVLRFHYSLGAQHELENDSIRIMVASGKEVRGFQAENVRTELNDGGDEELVFEHTITSYETSKAGQITVSVCGNKVTGNTITEAWHTLNMAFQVANAIHTESDEGEDTPETAASNAEKIAALQTLVDAITSGRPIPVDLKSKMTDTSAIYLYTGNETEEQHNYWYYHDGTTWVPGSEYGGMTIDDELSSTSENAVKNKVIKANFDEVNGRLGEFRTDLDLLEFSDYNSNSSDYVRANTSMFPSTSFGTSANYTVLAFMPVRKGDKVFYTGSTGANTGVAIVNTYTTNDASGYYSTLASGDGNTYANREFDITDDKIKYVACCFRTAENVPYRVVVIHSDTMLWHEVQALSDNLYDMQTPKSFFNIAGYYNNTEYVSSASRYMKVYDVSKYDKVELSGTFGSYANVYTLLDANLSVVRYVRNNSADNRQFDLNVDTSDGSWLYVGTMASIADTLALTAYSAEIDTQYYQHMNGSPQMGFYHDAAWSATSSAPTLLFAVSEGESVIVTGNADAWFNLYTFTDDNGTIKTYQRSLSGETTLHLVVPEGATRLYVASSATNTASLFAYRVKHFEGKPTNWTGKKIVWFGTSIPAAGYIGDTTENSYPKYIADMLGADIYNEAVGSSNVHCKQPDRVDAETNPYGFIGNFESVSRCLSNTTEEMQWIIDNYGSSIWTSGKVSSMPDVLKNQILANSYQTKLDKYLTAKTFPDLFVFDHGHNDPFNSLATENEYYAQYGEYNTYSFHGAMNFLIQRILNFNPYAKIVMIGEYTGKESDQIPAMQMQVATDWNIPISKDWEKLGWTKTKNIVVNGNWVKDGNTYVWTPTDNPTTMSVFARWIPDGIHPHTDPSNKALRHMASVIGQWLDNDIGKAS